MARPRISDEVAARAVLAYIELRSMRKAAAVVGIALGSLCNVVHTFAPEAVPKKVQGSKKSIRCPECESLIAVSAGAAAPAHHAAEPQPAEPVGGFGLKGDHLARLQEIRKSRAA